jgi:hypothetical protein
MTRQELRCFLDKHFCGCGNPTGATASLLRLLETFDHPFDDGREPPYKSLPKWIPDDGAMFLLVYWIDHLDLIEHGGGVLASWLTSKGKDLLEALRREKEDRFEALHGTYCIHGFDVEGSETHDCEAADAPESRSDG